MDRQTMNAVRLHAHGGPEVLAIEEVRRPAPRSGELLVRVRAAGLNPPDWYMREGMTNIPKDLRPPFSLPAIPGTDVSGVVVQVGEAVEGFAIGDEVFGLLRFPGLEGSGYAEYVAAPATDFAFKPDHLDHVEAAAAPMSGLTAWQFLIDLGHDHPSPFQEARHEPVPLGPGTKVLVNGAAGGVGHLAVQLVKWKGAQVTAVASTTHESFLRDLGADEFIDYTTTNAEDVARGMDLVLDTLGGPTSARFLRTLRRGGALFPVFFGRFDPAEVAALGVTTSGTQVRSSGAQLGEFARLLDSGTVRVAIDRVFPLSEAAAAHRRAERGHIQGKIVLTVD